MQSRQTLFLSEYEWLIQRECQNQLAAGRSPIEIAFMKLAMDIERLTAGKDRHFSGSGGWVDTRGKQAIQEQS